MSRKCFNEDEDVYLLYSLVVVDYMLFVVCIVIIFFMLEKILYSIIIKNFKKFKKVCIKGVLLF